MKAVFLDTNYLVALEWEKDQNHSRALQHWAQVSGNLPPLLTTTYVFDETVTFLNARQHHAKAVRVGERLIRSPSVRMIHVSRPLFREAWKYFQKHSDKQYSLTDCISFIVMQRRKITTAFTFDHHFVQAGFQIEP